jgi:hypothetical protein
MTIVKQQAVIKSTVCAVLCLLNPIIQVSYGEVVLLSVLNIQMAQGRLPE